MTTSTQLIAAIIVLVGGAPALAGVNKAWVSSTGVDTGTCTLSAPCATFAYAIGQANAGGEVDVKDSGAYGPVTVTKAISIVNGSGVLAGINVPSGGTGIIVSAGGSDKVILDGLLIDGHNIGKNGIAYSSGSSLKIRNCLIRNVTLVGIALDQGGFGNFYIQNTEVEGTDEAIAISGLNGTISGARIHANIYGVTVLANSNTTLVGSDVVGNSIGVRAYGSGANILMGTTTVSENNGEGVEIRPGGLVQSYGDNYINANQTDVYGTLSGLGKR